MGAVDFGSTEAGVVVMAVPCLILFLLLQRYYVQGFMSGSRSRLTRPPRLHPPDPIGNAR